MVKKKFLKLKSKFVMNPEDREVSRPSFEENDESMTQKFSKSSENQIQYGYEQYDNMDLDFPENHNQQ